MSKIYVTRGHKVMLDEDLATLYGVETHRLNEQMKRNKERFTEDFMFTLSEHEFADLISQNAASSWAEEESNHMTLLKIELLYYLPQ